MTRKSVVSDRFPAALGPYSHAIVAGGFVFCSGTAGIDPATGTVRDGIEAQTEQALRNLAVILEAAGASMADLVKTTIFYTNVDDFPKRSKINNLEFLGRVVCFRAGTGVSWGSGRMV